MIQGSLAKRYALALVTLASETKETAGFLKSVTEFGAILNAHPQLFETLSNKMLPASERKLVLEAVLKHVKLGETLQRFLKLLIDKKRFDLYFDIQRQFAEMADEQNNLLRAKVTSARPLPAEMQKQIAAELGKLTGKTVDLENLVDPKILAGVVTQIGHTVYDGSVATRLSTLKDKLLDETRN